MLWTGIRAKHSGAFIRGGNWNNGANDGPFTLNLNWNTGNTNNNVGFRCARYSSKIFTLARTGHLRIPAAVYHDGGAALDAIAI